MVNSERDAGKRWISAAVTELRQAVDIAIDCEWGPNWADAPSRYRRGKPKPPTTALLVLSAGSRRKICWIPEEELAAAGAKDAATRDRLRKRLTSSIEALRSTPKLSKRVHPKST